MAMTFEKNFYLRLELPIDIPVTDVAMLTEAIEKKKYEWNGNINHPVDALLYRRYIEQISEMKEKLKGAELYRIIADAVETINGRLAECMNIFSRKGYVTENEIAKICEEFKNAIVSDKYIRDIIKVPIKAVALPFSSKPPDPPMKPTMAVTMEKYERLLLILGKDNIYDFLGCSVLSTPEDIIRVAQDAVEYGRKSAVKSACVTAGQELGGLVMMEFNKPNAKEAYDLALKTYRAEKKLLKILGWFVLTVKGKPTVTHSVSLENYLFSITLARELGMSPQEADWFVYEYYVVKRKCGVAWQ